MKRIVFLAAVAVCFLLVSCKSKPTELVKPQLTEDAGKDAKAYSEYLVEAYSALLQAAKDKDVSKFNSLSTDIQEVENTFESYRREKKGTKYAEEFDRIYNEKRLKIERLTIDALSASLMIAGEEAAKSEETKIVPNTGK